MEMLRISRWGNSLAVRLPTKMAKELNLKEGDFVERDVLALKKSLPAMSREDALAHMASSRLKLPGDYRFDREEANSRSDG